MSDTSSLSELARFVGQSSLSSEDEDVRLAAVNSIVYSLAPRLKRRGVSDLLGAVMALSARTRRMLLPPTSVELDVYGPNGTRAVVVRLPQHSA